VVDDVTGRLITLIERRQRAFGPNVRANAAALAAACVGVALQVCEHAIDHGRDLVATQRLAAHLMENAFRNLDFEALTK
jgi:hypothetical protein